MAGVTIVGDSLSLPLLFDGLDLFSSRVGRVGKCGWRGVGRERTRTHVSCTKPVTELMWRLQ